MSRILVTAGGRGEVDAWNADFKALVICFFKYLTENFHNFCLYIRSPKILRALIRYCML